MHDDRSPEARAYRALYGTKRWKAIRAQQLGAEPLCAFCLKAGVVRAARVCDHVDPTTKLNPTTFFAGPFQSLCKPCHDSAKQGEERRGYSGECDASGWPTDPRHPANQRGHDAPLPRRH